MILPVSIQMRVLWTLAMGTVFVVLVQYQTSGAWTQQQGQQPARAETAAAEDLVSLALSKVVVDGDAVGSRDLLTGVARQIARYVVYGSGCAAGAPPPAAGPTIYVVTPTYRRPEQVADLTRLAQTLMLVRDVHWLVVEDAHVKSPQLSALLRSFGVAYSHLIGKPVRHGRICVFRRHPKIVVIGLLKKKKFQVSLVQCIFKQNCHFTRLRKNKKKIYGSDRKYGH